MAILGGGRNRALGAGLLVLCLVGTWLAWLQAHEIRQEGERVRAEQVAQEARTAAAEAAREKALSEAKAMQDALDAAETEAEREKILEKFKRRRSTRWPVGRPRLKGEWACPPDDALCTNF